MEGHVNVRQPNPSEGEGECLTGVSAASKWESYTHNVAIQDDPVHNITEIEAINVALAVKTFVSESDRGSLIRIYCDNMAAVHVSVW